MGFYRECCCQGAWYVQAKRWSILACKKSMSIHENNAKNTRTFHGIRQGIETVARLSKVCQKFIQNGMAKRIAISVWWHIQNYNHETSRDVFFFNRNSRRGLSWCFWNNFFWFYLLDLLPFCSVFCIACKRMTFNKFRAHHIRKWETTSKSHRMIKKMPFDSVELRFHFS